MPANNQEANRWIFGVAGVFKTLSEAQTIVNEAVTQAQADWDALPADQKAPTPGLEGMTRPEDITLEE